MQKKKKMNFLFASRLLVDKGIKEFLFASNKILDDGYNATFTIIGDVDKLNPSFINQNIIKSWTNKNKFYYGFQKNVSKFIERSDVVVLPSYREGFPKLLIEASAIGRPILTTNVPDAKNARSNINGFSKAEDKFSLYEGMKKIFSNLDNLEKMSLESRKKIITVLKKLIKTFRNLQVFFK